MNEVSKAVICILVGALLGGGFVADKVNSTKAAVVSEKEPVVLGHRVGPMGQEMLVIK